MNAYAADAARLAALGWRLFDADPLDKRPRRKGWQEDATADPDRVAELFRGGPESAAIAAVTGELFDVFDVEALHLELLRELIRSSGTALPPGPVARTGRGGVHLYVRASGLRNRDLYIGDVHVGETRGAGGLVIVPPSRSRHGGYTWLVAPWDVELPQAHPALVGMIPAPPPARLVPPPGPPRNLPAAVAALARTVAEAPEGKRNALLYWAACRAREEGAPPDVIDAALLRAALSAGLPQLEAERTLRSALDG